jgi:hypothetical protein
MSMRPRPQLAEGWHDLPGGGSVEIKDGFPFQICDKGDDNLNENSILAEAADYTETKLQWRSDGRARRWYQSSLVHLLFDVIKQVPDHQFWSYSKIILDVCHSCGDAIGVQWINRPTEPFRQWVCEACALEEAELSEGVSGE